MCIDAENQGEKIQQYSHGALYTFPAEDIVRKWYFCFGWLFFLCVATKMHIVVTVAAEDIVRKR